MPSSGAPHWVENRPARGISLRSAAELWPYRDVVVAFATRDFRVRYKQAALGVAWAAIQPLVGLVAFTLVFDRLAGVDSGGVAYPVFVLVGLAVWNYHAMALAQGSNALVANAALITKVYFPRLAAPLGSLAPPLVDLGVTLVLVAGVMALYGVAPGAPLALLPLAVVALVVATAGPTIFLAALNVRYRDVRQGVNLLLQLWLFASPVAYPVSLVDADWRTVYALNPMVGVIELWRWCLLARPVPSFGRVAVSLAVALVVLAVGTGYFLRAERRFADVI